MKRILVPGRNCRGIYDAERSGLLVDGRNYYRAFFDAASRARHYILIAGWQFERSMPLLRGSEQKAAGADVRMGPFLNMLCQKNPDLRIFILMWDFSAIVALRKEWFNKLVFDLTANERIHFRFDNRHAVGASHHQKLVVIDGVLAFVGGLDFSANGWDDRKHGAENAERILAGEQFEPHHDIQSVHTGPVAWELSKLFRERWIHAGGQEIALPPPSYRFGAPIRRVLPVAAKKTAVSITQAQTLVPILAPVKEIRHLYRDAIAAAEKLIFIETQYFSSQAVYQALKERMTDRTRPCPEIMLIIPKRLHTFMEDISLSGIQARMLRSLTEIAERNKRQFGVYYSTSPGSGDEEEKTTYIHSKLLLVDDRFLTVGSANITNRSMGMDTELNVTWEAASTDQQDLIRSIRRVRVNLLAEHTGLRKISRCRLLARVDGLVAYLNSVAERRECRLRRHTMQSFLEDISWFRDMMPQDVGVDPEGPVIEESIYELISRDRNGIFARGLLLVNQLALPETAELPGEAQRPGIAERHNRKKKLNYRYRWYLLAALGLGVGALTWLLLSK